MQFIEITLHTLRNNYYYARYYIPKTKLESIWFCSNFKLLVQHRNWTIILCVFTMKFKIQLHFRNIIKPKQEWIHSNVNPTVSITFHKIKCQKHNQRESQGTLHYWVYFSMFKASRLQRPPKSILTAEGASHD